MISQFNIYFGVFTIGFVTGTILTMIGIYLIIKKHSKTQQTKQEVQVKDE